MTTKTWSSAWNKLKTSLLFGKELEEINPSPDYDTNIVQSHVDLTKSMDLE